MLLDRFIFIWIHMPVKSSVLGEFLGYFIYLPAHLRALFVRKGKLLKYKQKTAIKAAPRFPALLTSS